MGTNNGDKVALAVLTIVWSAGVALLLSGQVESGVAILVTITPGLVAQIQRVFGRT